ncbi:MAG TPA: hypothetical protein VGG24_10640 [Paraburkholderia sp.]|jgi:hypothetical protein
MEQKIMELSRPRTMRAVTAVTSVTAVTLPAEFAHLQEHTGWALATETTRNMRRHSASMEEIGAFADAMLGEVERIVPYLDAFGQQLPDEARPLLWMLLSLAEVAPVLECYRQQAVIDGYDPRRFVADEDFVLKPAL